MIEFMKAGGFPIWIVLLLGMISLVSSVLFFRRPNERRIVFIRCMSTATLYATIGAIVSCLAAVMVKVPATSKWAQSPDMPLIVMTGIGESFTPGILGFSFLTLVWLFTALGMRRLINDSYTIDP